jgi:hypothetical protein
MTSAWGKAAGRLGSHVVGSLPRAQTKSDGEAAADPEPAVKGSMREKRPNYGYCGCAQGQPAVGQAAVVLRPHRLQRQVEPDQAAETMLAIAAGELEEAAVTRWLGPHLGRCA